MSPEDAAIQMFVVARFPSSRNRAASVGICSMALRCDTFVILRLLVFHLDVGVAKVAQWMAVPRASDNATQKSAAAVTTGALLLNDTHADVLQDFDNCSDQVLWMKFVVAKAAKLSNDGLRITMLM